MAAKPRKFLDLRGFCFSAAGCVGAYGFRVLHVVVVCGSNMLRTARCLPRRIRGSSASDGRLMPPRRFRCTVVDDVVVMQTLQDRTPVQRLQCYAASHCHRMWFVSCRFIVCGTLRFRCGQAVYAGLSVTRRNEGTREGGLCISYYKREICGARGCAILHPTKSFAKR
jgi:hypothetical protein